MYPETTYNGLLHVSIRAYYENEGQATYYRDIYLEELPKWLNAHTYTHPNVRGYTIQINRELQDEE